MSSQEEAERGGVRLAQISPSSLYNSLPNVKMSVFSKILEIFQSSSASPHRRQFDIVSYWLISGSYRYHRPCQVSLMKNCQCAIWSVTTMSYIYIPMERLRDVLSGQFFVLF